MIYNNNGMVPQTQPAANGPFVQQAPRPQPQQPMGGFQGVAGTDSRAKLRQAIMDAMQKKASEDAANNPSPWTAMGSAAAQMAGAYANRRNQQPVFQKYKSKMPAMGAPKMTPKIPGG